MHISQLPGGAIQYIVDLLPRDILERLLEFDNCVSPYAFKKYYARIKVIDNPSQFNKSTSYTGVERPEIIPLSSFTPYFKDEQDISVFGSLFSLSQFIKKNPEFIPTEITLETLASFVRLAYEYQYFLKQVKSIRLIQLEDSTREQGIGGALAQSFKLLHRVFNNIDCEVFKTAIHLSLDAFDIPSSASHVDIPSGQLWNFEEFFKQHSQIVSLEVSNLLEAPTAVYPSSLTYVGSLIPACVPKLKVRIADSVQVLSLSGRSFEKLGNTIDLEACTRLKHFELSQAVTSKDFRIILAPNLESLILNDITSNYGLSSLLVGQLPLKRIDLIGYFSMKFYHNFFYEYEFPEALEELYFENSNLLMDSTEYSDGVLPHPYLNDVFDLRINEKVKFPKGLKILHLSCPFTAIESTWKIPDTVKRLVLAHISYIVDLPGLVLPSNLENFFVEPIYGLISEKTTNSDLISFPNSLVSFTYYGKPVEYFQTNLLELPNLRNLVFASHGLEGHSEQFFINGNNIGNVNFQNLHNLQSFELNELPKLGELSINLPKSLRRFRIAMSEVNGFSQSFEFPPLESLILEQIGIDLDILNKLPSSVEHLELLECKAKMPQHLDLNLPHLRCLVMNDCNIDKKTFELLNLKRFTNLKVVGFQDNKIAEIDLALFPPSVTNLSVYKNQAKIIYGEDVNLPNLRNLELSENNMIKHYEEADSSVKSKSKFIVPEGIEWLKLRKCSISNFDFIVWPKELGAIALEMNYIPDENKSDIIDLCKRYAGAKCFDSISTTDLYIDWGRFKILDEYKQRGILKNVDNYS